MFVEKVFYIIILSLMVTIPVLTAPNQQHDDVVQLTAENFNQIIGSDTAWVVFFHLNYCGRCKRFAPFYKKLATSVKNWNGLIKIAALDCAVAKNLPICKDQTATKFPSVLYFEENFFPNISRSQPHIETVMDATLLEHYLIDLIVEEQKADRGDVYPELVPYENPAANITDDAGSSQIYLIVDEEGSYLGPQVTLDVHHTSNAYVRYTFDYKLVEDMKYYDLPTLLLVNGGAGKPVSFDVVDVKKSREAFVKQITKNGSSVPENGDKNGED